MWVSRKDLLRLKSELHRALAEAEETRRALARLEKMIEHIARHFQWPSDRDGVLPPSPDEEPTKK